MNGEPAASPLPPAVLMAHLRGDRTAFWFLVREWASTSSIAEVVEALARLAGQAVRDLARERGVEPETAARWFERDAEAQGSGRTVAPGWPLVEQDPLGDAVELMILAAGERGAPSAGVASAFPGLESAVRNRLRRLESSGAVRRSVEVRADARGRRRRQVVWRTVMP